MTSTRLSCSPTGSSSSASPGRFIDDIAVPIPRPRADDVMFAPEFNQIKRRCFDTHQARKHACFRAAATGMRQETVMRSSLRSVLTQIALVTAALTFVSVLPGSADEKPAGAEPVADLRRLDHCRPQGFLRQERPLRSRCSTPHRQAMPGYGGWAVPPTSRRPWKADHGGRHVRAEDRVLPAPNTLTSRRWRRLRRNWQARISRASASPSRLAPAVRSTTMQLPRRRVSARTT